MPETISHNLPTDNMYTSGPLVCVMRVALWALVGQTQSSNRAEGKQSAKKSGDTYSQLIGNPLNPVISSLDFRSKLDGK